MHDPALLAQPEVVVAIVAGGFMALTATISGIFSWFNSRASRQAVVAHVTDEEGTIAIFQAAIDRMDGKLDSVLSWQGQHDALHARQGATN